MYMLVSYVTAPTPLLLSHSLAGGGDNYLPLQVGNRWTYAWKNDYRQEAVIETWKIGEQPEDPASLPTRSRSGGTPEIKIVDPNSVPLDLSQDTWIKVAADAKKEFHFPYYVFIPKGIDPAADGGTGPSAVGCLSTESRVPVSAAGSGT